MNSIGSLLTALAVLFGVVAAGSTLPILPTGAAVSATAVLAARYHPLTLPLVVLVGAVAAYLGDAVTFAICKAGGETLVRRLKMLRKPAQTAQSVSDRLLNRPVTVLLVSRLVPGGRIPILLAGAVLGLSWRRFAVSNLAACALWSAMYAAIGLLGHSIFPEPWEAVVCAILIVLAVNQLLSWLRKRRDTTEHSRNSDHKQNSDQSQDDERGEADAGRQKRGAPAGQE